MEILQKPNLKDIKEWQAEACINVLLYCAQKISDRFAVKDFLSSITPIPNPSGWDLSRVGFMYKEYGDIYEWPITKKCVKAIEAKWGNYDYEFFKTNCRLIPAEGREAILQSASKILLTGSVYKSDQDLTRILNEELM
jgi:hypothetical protein